MIRKRFISFSVTEEEKAEIEEYCRHKKRWRKPTDLARDALWQHINRNPIYKKKAPKNGG